MVMQEKGAPNETSYKAIVGLESRIGQMANRKSISFRGEEGGDLKRVELPLGDGFSISIQKEVKSHSPLIDSGMRWVNVGGIKFCVTPDEFLLNAAVLPLQIQIGGSSYPIKQGSPVFLGLDLPEQEAVLKWVSTSIEQRKIGEFPLSIKANVFPQREKPRS